MSFDKWRGKGRKNSRPPFAVVKHILLQNIRRVPAKREPAKFNHCYQSVYARFCYA